ncbi:CPBP family intramembrane glutamic endopeptidase [Streptococcus macacae]|uniref:CAAX amino terminal protease family protein n=1 Tax=Streptococcus macacae NCTC 11558 TaxID=764298 RepID=G5JZ98_9STRE|nr:type II CAAX endopeptidase family protein [Streptococcus macacae]EHJ53239.1 CAAX amino terminal protease family protein [Streptococcus macacae NCTC 11558]SUN78347.1 metal-dependent membrane protease [Streptococcus macacae NCTC 11558]
MTLKSFFNSILYFVLALVLCQIYFWIEKYVYVREIWQVILLTLISLLFLAIVIFLARQLGLLEEFKTLKTRKAWQLIISAFLMNLFVQLCGSVIRANLEGMKPTNDNEGLVNIMHMNPWLAFFMPIIFAPIIEETIFRGLLMTRVFKQGSLIGFLTSAFAFGYIHHPDGIGSWVTYAGMGMVLAWVYQRSNRLEYSIMMHMLNNILVIVLIALTLYLS